MNNFKSVNEMMVSYVETITQKRNLSTMKLFGKAIMAGAMIALGAEASNVAAHGIADVGLARTVAGIVFPVGLMMVILLGAELFTGDCMLAIGLCSKNLKFRKLLQMLVTVYFGNFVGGFVIAFLTLQSGQYNYSAEVLGAYTIKVAVSKVNISFGSAIASGILCNILVCAAVLMAMCANDITGKLLASFFVIFAFVTSGFEHCVANMYYITAGLLCKINPDYLSIAMDKYNISAEQMSNLNIYGFLVSNLVPVTIGNIIGGAVMLGIPLYYLTIAKKDD